MTNNTRFNAEPFYDGQVQLYTRTVTHCEGTCINWEPCTGIGDWEYMDPESIDEMNEYTRTHCEGHEHFQFHEGGRLCAFDMHRCYYGDCHTRVRISLGTSIFDEVKLEYSGRCVSPRSDMLTIYLEDDREIHIEFSQWR